SFFSSVECALEVCFGLGKPVQTTQNLAAIQARLNNSPAIGGGPRKVQSLRERNQGTLEILKVHCLRNPDVAESSDLTVRMAIEAEQRQRPAVQLKGLDGVTQSPVERSFIQQKLSVLTGRQSLAFAGSLLVNSQGSFLQAETLVEGREICV